MGAPTLPSIAVPGQRLADSSSYTSGPGTYVRENAIYASIPGPVVLRNPNTDPKSKKNKILTVSRSPTPSTTTPTSNAQPPAAATPTPPPAPTENGLSLIGSTNKRIPIKFNTLPTVGSIVLGRVTRVQKRQATISILLVLPDLLTSPDPATTTTTDELRSLLAGSNMSTTADSFNADELRPQALIRKEDVRAVEKDRVVLEEAFRVGDIVRAVIVSVGDQAAYYASTAGNELGVVMARSGIVDQSQGAEGEGQEGGFGGNMMFPVSWKEMRDPVTGRGEMRKVAKPF